ncbi:helix-turn-helix transcriptional regulator [Tetragenococcus koreensis]|uniref:CBS domain-containing protein n=2 Tax=Tetragenococcus TaxID=51668 RepID=A0AB37D413_TETHA|nr:MULTISPECIES: helix-turn-helix transcriptional regulator [Tetragenococcus]MCF1586027.1 helix-turn-helix transcriptional regulator [Tetragenococcus koreensis]MCF1615616.1 helix-turn-helix transcriptional regulator [Tetragenococcus koreensis]MCF1620665.1 helix-turn-helix transcriptional regulator [Tetragenococcus koreensis]MCF1625422.1 helix-turn-helix transcriptional regulator [Tetragenococcus koreensis]MCF1630275.1 helix-turn-helix transcriptional regulator [Tetragenococcus koreensis]
MEFSDRQKLIMEIVKANEPITGDNIAAKLNLTKPTLRNDLSLLTMTGVLDARPKVGYIYSGQTIEPLLFEKLYTKKVDDIMIPAVFIKQDTSLKDAITDLFMYDVGSLYVVNEDKRLVGVLSRKDLLRSVLASNEENIPVAVVMSRMPNIITITSDETILTAGHLLMQHQVDSLPVVENKTPDKIVGKITKTRIMNHFIEEGIKVNA